MWGCVRRSRIVAAALLWALAAWPAMAAPPERVVSINLCTDQLAMMLAAPGQLVSVSALAREPQSSAMVAEAMRYPVNRGQAEEVFLLDPDLVLAGSYTTPATVDMLRRLGIPVVTLPPATSLDAVSDQIAQVGAALGRAAAADRLAADFEARRARLRAALAERPRAALYYANGYTAGDSSLAGEILVAAGFENVATEAGLAQGGALALERLVMLAPELVVEGARYPGASRGEALLAHPALDGLRRAGARTGGDWACGTPHVLRAIEELAAIRETLE